MDFYGTQMYQMALLNAYIYLLFYYTWKLDDTTQACLASLVTFVITLYHY